MLCTSSFIDDALGKWARIKHDVTLRRSLPRGGTSLTSDNYVTVCDRVHENVALLLVVIGLQSYKSTAKIWSEI